MRLHTAIILATPVVLGLVALIVRNAPKLRSTSARVQHAEPVRAADEADETYDAAQSAEGELEQRRLRIEERERVVGRLLANYEDRIARLIESIDWTRAESRVRFPIECELIKAEFAQVMSGLDGK